MAKEIFESVNYLIIVDGANEYQYPTRKCSYKEEDDQFVITKENGGGTFKIPFADSANWEDGPASGIAYSEETLRTFLRTKTATA